MTAGPPFRCKDYYGKEVSYQGIGFEGSPRHVFWGGYIEPFLEDITQRSIKETLRLASEKSQSANEPLLEVSNLLKSVAKRAYDRMADIDQRLLGKGFPEKVPRKSVDAEFARMENFIDQHIQSELAMTKRRFKINEFYNDHPFLFWFITLLVGAIVTIVAT